MSYFNYKGKQIYYEVHGTGKTIVILNGIMMSTISWIPFIDAFSANNQLILIDMLDQGRSDKMEGISYTSLEQVEVLKTLADELGFDKLNIVGISYGGEVALQFAVKYSDMIERLVLFNTTGKTSSWLRDIGEAWNRSINDPMDYYCTTIPYIYSPRFYEEKHEWMEKRKALLTNGVFYDKTFMDSMVRLTKSADFYDVIKELHKIKNPTLIVSSGNDFVTPLDEQKVLNQLITSSEHIILPNTGHASMYERPTLFSALALGFINLKQTEFNI
ncbi:alpha/beta hydrolase [Sedimentibacter sp.]|uniref:alpha/beta fold hydrolase n=1 Tax=Sedimentibacter sp. TaxID=1960295 RepID=UPI0028A7A72B|nr:alpha/beta hydrolase [Sedimentibacter sp.]